MDAPPPPSSGSTSASTGGPREAARATGWMAPRLVGVGVDGTASGRDAVALGLMLAAPTAAELMLIAVRGEPLLLVALTPDQNWAASEKQARVMLVKTRDAMAPDARTVVASDALMWRGLRRVAHLEHRDLLVVGSAREADDGRVRLGNSAADLMAHLECPLAVAPSGMAARESSRLERIGVGFDGRPASRAALDLATSMASAADAELLIRGVVDDGVPRGPRKDVIALEDGTIIGGGLASPFEHGLAAARAAGVAMEARVVVGMPTDVLSELAEQVDLLIIGSGRSRQPRRVQLGRTGTALLHYAACPMLVVPRERGGDPLNSRTRRQ